MQFASLAFVVETKEKRFFFTINYLSSMSESGYAYMNK